MSAINAKENHTRWKGNSWNTSHANTSCCYPYHRQSAAFGMALKQLYCDIKLSTLTFAFSPPGALNTPLELILGEGRKR